MSGRALRLIQPVSKRDQVVDSFKEAILSGIIQPGDAIVESKVAQQLGAGIPLIREALIELEHQGYVRKVPYKGTDRKSTRLNSSHSQISYAVFCLKKKKKKTKTTNK